MKPRFEIYPGNDSQWYWHLRAANGEIIADGSEGYASESNVRRAVEGFVAAVKDAEVVIESR